jgi:hypothetical protein
LRSRTLLWGDASFGAQTLSKDAPVAKTRKPRRAPRGFITTIAGINGAIDLASIMVGVIVIGIIAGVIAATVFAVIPWAQNNAAKQSLDAVKTAQDAYIGLNTSALGDSPIKTAAFIKSDATTGVQFGTLKQLQDQNLIQTSKTLLVNVGGTLDCYVAQSMSATGNAYYASSVNTIITEVKPGGAAPTYPGCDAIVPTAPVTGGGGGTPPNGGGNTDPNAQVTNANGFGPSYTYLEFDGTIAKDTTFPWHVGNVDNSDAGVVTGATATVNGQPVTIDTTGWTAWETSSGGGADGTLPTLYLSGNGGALGDQAEADAWIADGTFTATIDGIPGNEFTSNSADGSSIYGGQQDQYPTPPVTDSGSYTGPTDTTYVNYPFLANNTKIGTSYEFGITAQPGASTSPSNFPTIPAFGLTGIPAVGDYTQSSLAVTNMEITMPDNTVYKTSTEGNFGAPTAGFGIWDSTQNADGKARVTSSFIITFADEDLPGQTLAQWEAASPNNTNPNDYYGHYALTQFVGGTLSFDYQGTHNTLLLTSAMVPAND